MRLMVGLRQKSTSKADGNQALRQGIYLANDVMDMVQPWDSKNTRLNLRWFGGGASTALLMRSNEPETTLVREGWLSHKKRAWTWAGVVSDDFAEYLQASNAENFEFIEKAAYAVGSFSLLGATHETLTATVNAHRSEALYFAETADLLIVSNSAALVNLMISGKRPTYSHAGIAGAIVHGLPVTENVIFDGVRILPAGTTLVSGPQNDLKFVRAESKNIEDISLDELSEEIAESLVKYAKSLASGANKVQAAITGGKDSRMVVAALHAAEIDFEAYTSGLPESGEVEIGRRVTQYLGLKHNVHTPVIRKNAAGEEVLTGQPELQAWNTLRSTGGMGNAFTLLPDPRREHNSIVKGVNFGGQGGEIVRGGYLRDIPQTEISRERATQFFEKTWLNNRDLLNPLAQEVCRKDLASAFSGVEEDPFAGLFRAYVENRTGRWLSTMRHGESVVNSHTTLLINNQMVRRMLDVSPSLLTEERLAFKVMRRLAPGLVSIPFFRDRWGFEDFGPDPMFDPEGWAARAPHTAHAQPRATFNWRAAYSPSLAGFFKDYIFSFEDSILFDVIEKKAVMNLLDGKGYRAPAAWALFSTQYALSNSWLEKEPPSSPETVEIQVPK